VLNIYSRIHVAQLHEYESRVLPGSPCMCTYLRLVYSYRRLNMNRIPYSILRSAYSTCREGVEVRVKGALQLRIHRYG